MNREGILGFFVTTEQSSLVMPVVSFGMEEANNLTHVINWFLNDMRQSSCEARGSPSY